MKREKKESYDIIMGMHVLEELLKAFPKRVLKVYAYDTPKKDLRKKKLFERIREKRIPLEKVSKDFLSKITESTSHQGFVALIKKREILSLTSFLKTVREKAFVLMLDKIYDPHNMGAILRSSECFGASALIWSINRGVSITPTVSKVSSGASEFLKLINVSNLANSVDLLKKAGFSVIASSVLKDSIDFSRFTYPPKTVLILGSEGEGVSPLLLKKCDHTLYIPMKGRIDSLNVSNAAAVFLSRI